MITYRVIIKCDAPGCPATYEGVPSQDSEKPWDARGSIKHSAFIGGWKLTVGHHLCPACAHGKPQPENLKT